jgi:hypothetical protein
MNAALQRAVRAEVTKLTTLRTPVGVVVGTAVGTIALSWLITALTSRAFAAGQPQDAGGLEPGTAFLVVLRYAQIGAVLLGGWVLAQERDNHAVRATMLAVPHRRTAYLAKVLVTAAVTAVTAVVTVLGSAAVRCAATDCGARGARLAPDVAGEVRVLGGVVVYWTLLAVLTFALGALVRNGLTSIGVVLGLALALSPYLVTLSPLARFLPDQAGAQLSHQGPFLAGELGPVLGLVVLVAWTLGTAVAGDVSFRRWAV